MLQDHANPIRKKYFNQLFDARAPVAAAKSVKWRAIVGVRADSATAGSDRLATTE
jgi:hypothetical protein